jgi:hypothetical protein
VEIRRYGNLTFARPSECWRYLADLLGPEAWGRFRENRMTPEDDERVLVIVGDFMDQVCTDDDIKMFYDIYPDFMQAVGPYSKKAKQ